jgi:ubiquinone/menaquinone biosynthesis C-methylase UbiE
MNDKSKSRVAVSDQNILYYDAIASNYDEILDRDAANAWCRGKVAAFFVDNVKGGQVLDFGGGTGQDLGWLAENNYEVLFCEPSTLMRNIAIERSKQLLSANIRFLHERQCDFTCWPDSFPETQRVSAILANFAVLNCVPDIPMLFEKFANVLISGGLVVALVLKNGPRKRLASNLRGTLKSLLTQKTVTITIDYHGNRQIVYIHSMRQFKKAMGDAFAFFHHEQLRGTGFRLICLRRK